MILFLIAVFGALGCVIRFLAEYATRLHHPTRRPWATAAVNAVGSGIAGYVAYRFVAVGEAHVHQILLTGFTGGLTTFSSAFAVPAILQREHHWGYSLALILTTPALCGGFFALGMVLAR